MADIDAAMVAACGLPMGPLTLLDLIGLDVSLDVLETMFDETRDQRYAPAPLLRRLVMAGRARPQVRSRLLPVRRRRGRCDGVSAGVRRRDAAVRRDASSRWSTAVEARRCCCAGRPGSSPRPRWRTPTSWSSTAARAAGRRARCPRRRERRSRRGPRGRHDDEAPVATFVAGTGRAADVVGAAPPACASRAGVSRWSRRWQSTPQAVATVVDVVAWRRPDRRSPAGTGRATWSTHLVLPHLGDAVRMVDDGYATATTSTPRCGSAAAIRRAVRDAGGGRCRRRAFRPAASRRPRTHLAVAWRRHRCWTSWRPRMSPRRARRRDDTPAPLRTGGSRSTESHPDGEWLVRPVAADAADKTYRCPGCEQEIAARPGPHWSPGGPATRTIAGTGTPRAGEPATGACGRAAIEERAVA